MTDFCYSTLELYANLEERILAEIPYQEDEFCVFPKSLAPLLGIPVDVCKSILRELRNQGKVVLFRGLMGEDGLLCGSGYMRSDTVKEADQP